MSVYSEMLRLALADDDSDARALSELISRAVNRRSALVGEGDAASRLGDTLAYDVALVRLCERLGIAHHLTGEHADPQARLRAESELVAQMPSLMDVLASINPDRS